MDIDNQSGYWDSVAAQKTFTHPVDLTLLSRFVNEESLIADYGCGYGRLVKTLSDAGYHNIKGFDTSAALIARGHAAGLSLTHIDDAASLPLSDNAVDCFLLFAVLTCIPTNKGQQALIDLLYQKLKPGGILYISDYYLQPNRDRYAYYNGDKDNYGVFTLPEGATLRHHPKEWIDTLLSRFTISYETTIQTRTMNNNPAEIFQLVASKPSSAIV